jgi:predicted Zn-dependent peptidase
MSSRLFQKLREDTGLAYAIHSSASFFHDTGDLVIAGGLDSAKLPRGLKIIRRELEQLANRPPAPRELERARDYVLGQFELGLENTETQMMNLGEQWLGWGRIIPPAEIHRRLRGVTPADIAAAAQAFFRPERCCLTLVGPVKNAAPLADIFS